MGNFGIDWSQNSTKRGAIWLVAGVVGLIYTWGTKDTTQLMFIASTVAGGMGVGIKD
ncbi:MAG: hypothetical protein Q8N35_13190 [Methylococcaceae bacterium]|nr:hypothetical protein [Methylococcaceae bacterium]MDP2395033.1 hypothetical protein [Methylococcaceae bacterium]MDP3020533.1 hypothetical protein [Methylococcaceae bacterium]MDP3389724.1 hypothetical protein [Methylococcaceae bacterium]MDP3932521.1 hypothetical protein [Methylococcaceae bacterium]